MSALRHRWPRTMRKATAAEYVERSVATFDRMVADGTMPEPFFLGGAEAWDIQDLDQAVDALKAGARRQGSWLKDAERYAQTRKATGRNVQAR